MFIEMFVAAGLAVYFIVEICQGSLLKGPVNTTVSVGERVVLQCHTNLTHSVYWRFNETEVFHGGKISRRYSSYFDIETNGSKGEYNLVIPSANGWYNGLYTCIDDEGEGERLSALLIVADSTNASQKTRANVLLCIFAGIAVLIGLSPAKIVDS